MRRSVILGGLFWVVVGMLMGCDEENIVAKQLFDEPLSHARFIVVSENFPSPGIGSFTQVLGMEGTMFYQNTGLKLYVRPINIDEDNALYGPMMVFEGQEQRFMPQCGTYEIFVSKYGEPLFHDECFEYSGEEFMEVAQGYDWKIIISRRELAQ